MDRSTTSTTILYAQAASPRTAVASHHRRSVSQSAFFSLDSLPPLCPPFRKTSPASSISDSADMSAAPGTLASGDGLPPRQGHRRSHSDVQTGLSSIAPTAVKFEPNYDETSDSGERKSSGNVGDDLLESFLNFDRYAVGENSDFQSRGSANSRNGAHSSESEAESCAFDCGTNDEPTLAAKNIRHYRSISMDGLTGLSFGEGPLMVPPSPGSKRNQSSEYDSMDGTFSLEFGNGEFSGTELRKIMSDKRLEEIALSDPKRAKRIVANRQSAARSKERKVRYISELECKVKSLQAESTTLSVHLTSLQRNAVGLVTQNNELKIRLQAMEQQAQLRDALNEALSAEVQRLRLATAELDDSPSIEMKQVPSIRS